MLQDGIFCAVLASFGNSSSLSPYLPMLRVYDRAVNSVPLVASARAVTAVQGGDDESDDEDDDENPSQRKGSSTIKQLMAWIKEKGAVSLQVSGANDNRPGCDPLSRC